MDSKSRTKIDLADDEEEHEAFILFALDHHWKVKESKKHFNRLQVKEELRELWNQASEQVKNHYYLMVLAGKNNDNKETAYPRSDDKKHSLSEQPEELASGTKKRKLSENDANDEVVETLVFCDDILKEILLFLDAPDFVNSQPWLVCKQWNQLFFKNEMNFAQLYYHSYFNLNEHQKNSLHRMLKTKSINYKKAFSMLLNCFQDDFSRHHERLLRTYETTKNPDLLTQMKEHVEKEQYFTSPKSSREMTTIPLPRYAKIRKGFLSHKILNIVKENLFRHVKILNRQKEKLEGSDFNYKKTTTDCLAFLSNGYPLEVNIVYTYEATDDSKNVYESVILSFDDTTVFEISFDRNNLERDEVYEDYDGMKSFEKILKLKTERPMKDNEYVCMVVNWLQYFVKVPIPGGYWDSDDITFVEISFHEDHDEKSD
ncbi:hypothetical protein C9374_003509 [Naegleria lovaniensis]|uniref:F-box domain-containing protein n=1 Tax=Naegleria lovaniensis TaxID=51637 RepID=A0AA88GT76_NAELO|nr:uncharacterized protein C9374_003509 [Naegleria lovaniensis]KAG2385694.1 hypothetical protein C9374_003509 [Naegleria lovaniensis]